MHTKPTSDNETSAELARRRSSFFSDVIDGLYGYWSSRGSFPTAVVMLRPVHALDSSSDADIPLQPNRRDLHLQLLDPFITPLIRQERLTFAELGEAMAASPDAPSEQVDEDLRWRWLMSAVRRRVVVEHAGAKPEWCTWDLTNAGRRTSGPVAALGPIARLLGIGSVLAFLAILPVSDILHMRSETAWLLIGLAPAVLGTTLALFQRARARTPDVLRQVCQRERDVQSALSAQIGVPPWWPPEPPTDLTLPPHARK